MRRMAVSVGPVTGSKSVDVPSVAANSLDRRAAALNHVFHDEGGQSFAEYGLILALVVVVAAAGLGPVGTGLGGYITATVGAVVAML